MRALLLVPVALLTAVPAAAQPRMAPQEPTVAAAGQAVVRRAPDQAFVTFATESRAPRPEAAQQANARAMEKVRKELRDQKIPDAAIRTLSFNLREDFDYTSGGRVSRGFVVTNAIEVRVDDLSRLGRLVDEVVQAGATSVSGIRFELKDREAAEREALRQAVEDARARAEALAAGAGLRIVRVQSITDQGVEQTPPPMPMMRMEARADAAETPMAPGEIEIRASVRLTAVVEPR